MTGPDSGTTIAGPGLLEPLPPELHRLLRSAVLDHITTERRRTHGAVLNAGLPGRAATLTLGTGDFDHALRTDAVEALLRRAQPPPASADAGGWTLPLVWLTRRGTLEEVHDLDVAWLSATRTAACELGREVPMVVVTRQGWRDPLSGTTRTWRRLRPPRP